TYFTDMNLQIRRVEQARLAAEPGHLKNLVALAARAYRRRLSRAESAELIDFYRRLRDQDHLSHEDALRDTLATILMSSHFCYLNLDTGNSSPALSADYALASRLSYFLWSSMPDAELLVHAATGNLHEPGVLGAQTRRMLKDPRLRGLAEQFAGNWLDFRRFE